MELTLQQKKKLVALLKRIGDTDYSEETIVDDLTKQIEEVKQSIPDISPYFREVSDVKTRHASLASLVNDISDKLSFSQRELLLKIGKSDESLESFSKETLKVLEELKKELEKLGIEVLKPRGGSMNRGILINGVNYLTRYTDINLLGSGVTFSAVNNDTLHTTDITFTSSGGSTFINNEIVSGSGTSWTLANTPTLGTQCIYANGQRLTPGTGNDYTISGADITTANSYAADSLLADYQT